ncbi:hypothetical protein ACWEOZ_35470 [Actinoplanes sp. NPDC004185]
MSPSRIGGARVREISVAEAIEIRRAVEGLVAAWITDTEIAHLHELGKSVNAAVRAADMLRYSKLECPRCTARFGRSPGTTRRAGSSSSSTARWCVTSFLSRWSPAGRLLA